MTQHAVSVKLIPYVARPTIEAFDAHLVGLGLRLEAVVIGGSALALLGVTNRQRLALQAASPEWPKHVADTLDDLVRRIGDGL